MKPLLLSLQDHPLADRLRSGLNAEEGTLLRRQFPDGESYLRIDSDVAEREVIILADLAWPDDKFLPLSFLCQTLRELGASAIGLVVPYLPYMRQDIRFQDGEAITSRIFAQQLSTQADWLVTVDPHLHRYHQLSEIYTIPATAVHGAPLLAEWIKENEAGAFLVGPDAESEQWVSGISQFSGQPYVIGDKIRRGDRDVEVTLPTMGHLKGKTAVIIDDVISSGQTLLRCIDALKARGIDRIDCVAIHGLFADGIDKELQLRGLNRLVTSNSIPHPSNQICLASALIQAIKQIKS